MEEKTPSKITAPGVSMPSGGGAMRSISEPFKAESFSGSGGFSIPFALPAARGFSPQLSVAYSSAGGCGFFGLGFAATFDSVALKTSTGVPRYDGHDVFILSGAGELVPKYDVAAGNWEADVQTWKGNGVSWKIRAYRPRVEGAFSRIEQWMNLDSGLSHWKVVTAANETHRFGVSDNGRIYDPQNPGHIFEWLIESSEDACGNKILYQYKAGDTVGIPDTPFNTARDFTSQRYPWKILYGNYFAIPGDSASERFAFEVCFDYGQINKDNPDMPCSEWAARPDPFSMYKSGFEIRTARRCNGIFLRQRFSQENNDQPFTTRAVFFDYTLSDYSQLSLLESVTWRGYRMRTGERPWMEDMPPVTIGYQSFDPLLADWQTLEADAPGYFNSSGFLPVDLDGLGISGLLYTNESFTGYLAPLGHGKFAPMRVLEQFPAYRDLANGTATLTSLEGNNIPDLVVSDGSVSGFFERAAYAEWKPFLPFAQLPVEFYSPEKQFVDLSGSGRADILLFDNDELKHYASLGKTGYSEARFTTKPFYFPAVPDEDEAQLTGFADFLGDGLSHRYLLANGSLTIWPSLGHGKFGTGISFANAPMIYGLFESKRVFLVDADGNGLTDIAYLFPAFVRIWFNQNGNSFSAPIDIPLPAPYNTISEFTTGDVTGYGTTSLLFTVPSPELRHYYYDISNREKPYLLRTIDNGMGGLSSIAYTTSVLEQLRDAQQGRNWVTRLPMPVHVVSRSTTTDQLSGASYTQRTHYHDGYFDPEEREFRGFGFVETWDTDTYERLSSTGDEENRVEFAAPIYTKSWFLTGAYEDTPSICRQYQSEFYRGDAQQWLLPEFLLGPDWENAEAQSLRQAYASLAGQGIRTEIYGEDNSPLQGDPYTVTMNTIQVRLLQPRIEGKYCCVQTSGIESLAYAYDRNAADPKITQQLVLAMNEYGQTLLAAAISYPRRNTENVLPEQQELHCVVSDVSYTNASGETNNDPETYWQRIGISWQQRSYEIGGLVLPQEKPFTRMNLLEQVTAALQNPVSESISPLWSRLLSWSYDNYWNDSQTDILQAGSINALALLCNSMTAVITPAQLTAVYGDKVTQAMMIEKCGYTFLDGYWWNTGLVQHYYTAADQLFYLPWKTDNPVAQEIVDETGIESGLNCCTTINYDFYLLNTVQVNSWYSSTQALTTNCAIDYEAMAPWQSANPNGNVSEVLFDPLGKVLVSTIYGTLQNEATGDLPVSDYTIIADADFEDVIADPAKYLQGATSFFYYDLFVWKNAQQPVSAVTITRNLYVSELETQGEGEDATLMPVTITYNDGLGRLIQAKGKTSPGEPTLSRKYGTLYHPVSMNVENEQRWIVSGRTVYDNKGQPVEQYLPFFSSTPLFEDQQAIIDEGLTPPPAVLHYDPLGRLIKTDSPKGFFSRTVYSPWQVMSYDFNDTLPDSLYYKSFMANYPEQPALWQIEEKAALEAALPCRNTPSAVVYDNMGNTVRSIACNLGVVSQDSIPEEIAWPQTPQQAWQSLVDAGYLSIDPIAKTQGIVTKNFQPYQQGFHATFMQQFGDNVRLEDYLTQSCLTTLSVFNVQGQLLSTTDPRLFLQMVRNETPLYNFRSTFNLQGQTVLTESADAGIKCTLTNMYGNNYSAWDSRNFNAVTAYDVLQRMTSVQVTGGDGESAMNNTVLLTIYGEQVPNAAESNLMGNVYKQYDESGLAVMLAYGLSALPLSGENYLRPDYKTEADWTAAAQQEILSSECFTFSKAYNAAGKLIAAMLPDGSSMSYFYDINGKPLSMLQEVNNAPSESSWQTVISTIEY
ncbi:MAG: hypothetical protein M3R17_13030, partial [Bacteroidota bacterium]|nr:hypothetical protein [Bacteroidota bacterium]